LAEEEGAARSLAWVVMPDHFHWLIELHDSTLSTLMRRAKSRGAHSINRALGRQCQVWQKGFHDRALRSEEDIKAVARYIVANPLRAGLGTAASRQIPGKVERHPGGLPRLRQKHIVSGMPLLILPGGRGSPTCRRSAAQQS
nr:hypothetical protein [Tanacetum cinerariifolium]